MRKPPFRIVAVVATTVALAVVAFGVAVATMPATLTARDAVVLVVLMGMLVFARRAPLPIGPNQHLLVGAAPLFAATLLLPTMALIAAIGVTVLFADRSRHHSWIPVSFNTAIAVLQVACGSAVALVTGGGTIVEMPALLIPVSAALAALAMYAVNVGLVELIVAVQHQRFSAREMLRRRRIDLAADGGLYALGLLIALLAGDRPAMVLLLAAPALLIYRSLRQSLKLQQQLEHHANHDELTNLPNRRLFTERLTHALSRTAQGSSSLAVLFLDIDGFKLVNDTLGHGAGDELLQAIAQRLTARARPIDTVARLGGDEFIILLQDSTEDEASRFAESILCTLRQPLELSGRQIQVDASIGIVHSAGGHDNVDDLLTRADIAMYHAKSAGKGRFAFFVPEMATAVQEQVELEIELRRALEEQELVVYYQPTIDLGSGRITGCEALVRWQHPTRGLVPPGQFIPLAEETGLIVPLGRQVLRAACAQHGQWAAEIGDAESLSISVNLSTKQLQEASIVEDVAAILAETGIPTGCLLLEITESAMLHDTEEMLERLRGIKALGVRLALDDFGTGYSSLSYLHRFPFDVLKIDRAFVDGLDLESHTTALAGTIVRMGRSLGMKVVAEGIELSEQEAVLSLLGCDYGQGYFYSRPVTADALLRLLLADLHAAQADEGAQDEDETYPWAS